MNARRPDAGPPNQGAAGADTALGALDKKHANVRSLYDTATADYNRAAQAKVGLAAAPGQPMTIPGEGRMDARTLGGSPGAAARYTSP